MADTALIQAPEPLTDSDNVGPLYVDYRNQAADDALIDQARQRAQALADPEAAPKASAAGLSRPQTFTEALVQPPVSEEEARAMGAGGLERMAQFGVAAGKDIGK